MYSLRFSAFATTLIISSLSFATPISVDDGIRTNATSAPKGCPDPSLAQTVYQSFLPGPSYHSLNFLHVWENANSISNGTAIPEIRPAFRAWTTPQNPLLPLFQLVSTKGDDVIFRTAAAPQLLPNVSGFTTNAKILAWVFNSQVCNSVPLLSAAQNSSTDHYFTTNQFDHDGLISDGWVDSGVVAYVLPLGNS